MFSLTSIAPFKGWVKSASQFGKAVVSKQNTSKSQGLLVQLIPEPSEVTPTVMVSPDEVNINPDKLPLFPYPVYKLEPSESVITSSSQLFSVLPELNTTTKGEPSLLIKLNVVLSLLV